MSVARALDHARTMSPAEHRPTCAGTRRDAWGAHEVHPDPACPGCVTDREREQWQQQADELAAYLELDPDDPHDEDPQYLAALYADEQTNTL